MSDLALEAERLKLARLLGCDEAKLGGLAPLGVMGLRQLRSACMATLYDGDRASLTRIVAAAKLMPGALNALVAEKAMGPVLASRVAGLLPPQTAVDIARRTMLGFNVQVTMLLDPRSAAPMLRLMPVPLVVDVSREMTRRREYITMARFVDALTDEQIRAVMAILDDEALLRVGFFVESPKRLEEVIGLMTDRQLQNTMAVAARPDLGLAGPALMLLSGVSPALRARLAEAAIAHSDPAVGEHLVAAAREHGMIDLLASTAASLPEVSAARLRKLAGAA